MSCLHRHVWPNVYGLICMYIGKCRTCLSMYSVRHYFQNRQGHTDVRERKNYSSHCRIFLFNWWLSQFTLDVRVGESGFVYARNRYIFKNSKDCVIVRSCYVNIYERYIECISWLKNGLKLNRKVWIIWGQLIDFKICTLQCRNKSTPSNSQLHEPAECPTHKSYDCSLQIRPMLSQTILCYVDFHPW
jgi:hypothetical protein